MSVSVIEHPETLRTDACPQSSRQCTEVVPEGDLDAHTLPCLMAAIDEAARTGARVEVDLSGVDFMSIAAAAYVWNRATHGGSAAIEIIAASASAARALVVTGFCGAAEV